MADLKYWLFIEIESNKMLTKVTSYAKSLDEREKEKECACK